ncbi:hypothetical protein [Embleya sp. NBC_00896]|uniref:hypothetical protein n=1 Tax=Embleya sp. NBC_00896 TaxID=2975961 RepID=UPI002F918E92|nr:hypothetical protein OG928_46200 [Embleya sp. NBC_00896]
MHALTAARRRSRPARAGALFTQAGVTAARTLGDLVATTALLHSQPLPIGASVAVIGNAGGAGVLAADACVDAGLAVPRFGPGLEARLRALLPAGASCANPVDTTATATVDGDGDGDGLRACIDTVVAAGHVDAVVLALAPTALGDPLEDILQGPAVRARPVVVVAPECAAAVDLLAAEGGTLPVYTTRRRQRRRRPSPPRAAHAPRPLPPTPALKQIRIHRDGGSRHPPRRRGGDDGYRAIRARPQRDHRGHRRFTAKQSSPRLGRQGDRPT